MDLLTDKAHKTPQAVLTEKMKGSLLSELKKHHTVSFNGKELFIDLPNGCVWGCSEYGVDSYVSSSDSLQPAIDWLVKDTSELDERGDVLVMF